MSVRKDLLWLKYQMMRHESNRSGRVDLLALMEQRRPDTEDEDDEDSYCHARSHQLSSTPPDYYLGQSGWDLACAHPCCIVGCYRDDRSWEQDRGEEQRNLCRCLWSHFNFSILGWLTQCCGVCALAQEAREIEHVLLPPSYRRIDYITMQAMTDYYPAIYKARWDEKAVGSCGRCCSCFGVHPLSRLSIRFVQGISILSLILLAWSIGGKYYWQYVVGRHNKVIQFDVYNFLVFVAAWVQSLGLLTLIACFVHRQKRAEISLDALIKYFAAGFCLSTSLAVFWEIAGSLVIKVFITLVLLITGVGEAASPEDGVPIHWAPLGGFGTSMIYKDSMRLASSSIKDFVQAFGNDHPVFYSLYILVTAFILAALIEELCKYFGFRMVEHPDFLSSRDLVEASRVVLGENDGDEEEEQDIREEGRRSRRSGDGSYAKQGQSLEAKGNSIMLAMIAVAIGFACCENLVYLFIYSSGSLPMQLMVLVSRSMFPVHPIAAALQSIGVCRRDLEGARDIKLGRILLPAILFHGGYDFFILWIDFLARRNMTQTNKSDDDGSNESAEGSSVTAVLLSFIISMLSMTLALYYLWSEGRQQRQRLIHMDRRDAVDRSSLL